jgi:hypothetical protein
MTDESEFTDDLDLVERRRAARKAAMVAPARQRRALDLERLDSLECEHGDGRVAHLEVPYESADLPTIAVVRCPSPPEIARYRARVKPRKDGKPVDTIAAAEELADSCLVYPEGEVAARLYAARPGLKVQLGSAAVRLATGREEHEGKE